MKTNKLFFEVWGLRLLALTIATIIALVFYVRFYQTFLGDWQSAAWAALAVSIGSVIVTAYAIQAFSLDMAKTRNRCIFAALWIFAIGLFLFDRATETYTMQSKKTERETNNTNSKLAHIDSLEILRERLAAIRDANKRLAMLEQREKETGLLYVTLRREAQRERRIADSLYHEERTKQIAIVQHQSETIALAGIQTNSLGGIVKHWPSAALGLVVLGLLVASYWRESEQGEQLAGKVTSPGIEGRQASPEFILPTATQHESPQEYRRRIAQLYRSRAFPPYINQAYLAGKLGIRKGTMSKLVHGKLGNRRVSKISNTQTLETSVG